MFYVLYVTVFSSSETCQVLCDFSAHQLSSTHDQ